MGDEKLTAQDEADDAEGHGIRVRGEAAEAEDVSAHLKRRGGVAPLGAEDEVDDDTEGHKKHFR